MEENYKEPVCEPVGALGMEPVSPDNKEWRKRKAEILIIARELLDIAEEKGIKPHEFCQLGRSCDFLR